MAENEDKQEEKRRKAVSNAREKMSSAIESTDDKPSETKVKKVERDGPLVNEDGQAIIKQIKVYSPYKTYFDGPATSISAENETGPFDILPGHKNFMTLLSAGDIIVRTSRGGEEHIKTNNAVMHVSENVVRVFLDV
jgi:hypothetical protein